jgi:hypothetical protein
MKPNNDDIQTIRHALMRAGFADVSMAMAGAVLEELRRDGLMVVQAEMLAALQEKAAKAAHIV